MATTEVAILFPLVIVAVLAVVQGALWAHAGAVAQAAADHGVEVAAALGSSDEAGELAAADFLANAGTIDSIVIVADNDDQSELVQLRVAGSYPTLLGTRSVQATATTTRERLPD